MKSSDFDDDIPHPPHTYRFPHTEVWFTKYLSECNVTNMYSELKCINTSPFPPQNNLI